MSLEYSKRETFYILKLIIGNMSAGKAHILTTHPNLRDLRWSPGQIAVHLAMSGCGLNTGGLLGTGTVSSRLSIFLPKT